MINVVDGDDITDDVTSVMAVPGIPNLYLVERRPTLYLVER